MWFLVRDEGGSDGWTAATGAIGDAASCGFLETGRLRGPRRYDSGRPAEEIRLTLVMIDNQTLSDFKSRHRGGGSCGIIWRKAPSGIRVPGMGSGTATTLDVFRPRDDLPAWTASGREEGIELAAFSSGAALALLDRALADPDGMMPAALLRDRLALGAAEACLKFEGRRANEAEIRDAACLTRAGDALGPAGGMFDRWRRMARIDLARKDRADRSPRSFRTTWPRSSRSGSGICRARADREAVLSRGRRRRWPKRCGRARVRRPRR